jgi:hypothetical protein
MLVCRDLFTLHISVHSLWTEWAQLPCGRSQYRLEGTSGCGKRLLSQLVYTDSAPPVAARLSVSIRLS